MVDPDDAVAARHVTGSASEADLKAAIGQAWKDLLADPAEKTAIAKLLGVDENELDPKDPPFTAEITGSGLTGGEVLIAFATAFALAAAKDLGSAAGKAFAKKLRSLWADYMKDRVSPLGSGRLGDIKDDNAT